MSVVGFDDIHLAEFANPPLSTVRMSREDLARAAFKGLKQLREEEVPGSRDPIRVETSLIVRQSTDTPKAALDGFTGRPRESGHKNAMVLQK
jgi:DNA-binding LacI/PurR family transcriptional regulator